MARPKTPPDMIEQIKSLWGEDRTQNAVVVWKRFGQHKISKRKVQQIISEARKQSPFLDFVFVEWQPWITENESSDAAAFLLKLDAVCSSNTNRHLYEHEAMWARRLLVALDSLDPWRQFLMVERYGLRERVAYELRASRTYTADLDAILAYQPWLPENTEAYEISVSAGVSPRPHNWFEPYDDDNCSSYWDVAKRMLNVRHRTGRRIYPLDEERSSAGEKLDGVVDFWAGLEPHSPKDRKISF